MTTQAQSPSAIPGQSLIICNRLILKAINTKTREALIFTILNDTNHLIRYDRAVLWNLEDKQPKLLGVSGQFEVSKNSELTHKWNKLLQQLKEPSKPQQITAEQFNSDQEIWTELQSRSNSAVFWLPIFSQDKLVLGLWIERWNSPQVDRAHVEILELFMNFLMPGYASAWQKFASKFSLKKLGFGKFHLFLFFIFTFFLLFYVHIPLRIVAPCEVVPGDPYLVTAPLEGIIEEIKVEPGQYVKTEDILVEYDKRVPLQELKIAQKEVQILQAEENRAMTLGLEDAQSLTELGIYSLRLQKAKVNLDLAEYWASLLTVKASQDGIVMLTDPDEWRGKPVRVGEKILTIGDPTLTKIRIWLPESDNVILDPDIPIKIFLNINPTQSRMAKVIYIANESTINAQNLPSFVAEADWMKHPREIKLGLKGTAILYGQKVNLFYFVTRKPLSALRYYLGI